MKTKTSTVRLTDTLENQIIKFKKDNGFNSKSEVIRYCIVNTITSSK